MFVTDDNIENTTKVTLIVILTWRTLHRDRIELNPLDEGPVNWIGETEVEEVDVLPQLYYMTHGPPYFTHLCPYSNTSLFPLGSKNR